MSGSDEVLTRPPSRIPAICGLLLAVLVALLWGVLGLVHAQLLGEVRYHRLLLVGDGTSWRAQLVGLLVVCGLHLGALGLLARARRSAVLPVVTRFGGGLLVVGLFAGLGGALARLEATVRVTPRMMARELNHRGYHHMRANRGTSARADFRRARALDPTFTWPYNNAGIVWGWSDSHEKSLELYDRALELDPRYANVLANRAGPLVALGRVEEGVRSIGRAVSLVDGRRRDYRMQRAYLFLDLERWEEALEDLNVHLARRPRDAEGFAVRAKLLARLERWDGWFADLRKLAVLRDDYASWRALGVALLANGRGADAVIPLEKARARAPEDAHAELDDFLERARK